MIRAMGVAPRLTLILFLTTIRSRDCEEIIHGAARRRRGLRVMKKNLKAE